MSLGDFKGKFGQGIRPNLYQVTGNFGSGGDLIADEALLIKAASMPSASLGVVTVPFKGREIKRAGDRTFSDWTISVLCDEENAIHEKFINWSNSFYSLDDINRGLAYGDWRVSPLSVGIANNSSLAGDIPAGKTIILEQCWPAEVGTIDFSYDTTDAVAEFSVTIGFDHWKFE
jgi:hypothetical protein